MPTPNHTWRADRSSARRLLRTLLAGGSLFASSTPVLSQITPSEYAARRDSLAGRIDSGIVVTFGGRTPVADFGPFYQLPAFRYLTGFDEPDATYVLVKRNGRVTHTLYMSKREPRLSLYYGRQADSAAVARSTGIPTRGNAALTPALDSLAELGLPLYSVRDFEDADFAANDSVTRGGQMVRGLQQRHANLVVRDGHPIVDQLLARKSPAEVALIKRAAEISADGHRALMRSVAPGMHEYDLAAIIEYTFRRGGAQRPAYGSIVGTGQNGTQLHYMKDTARVEPGQVVVIDAAAEYDGYAADVTRTIPVSGTYTPEQRVLYQLVRDAQAAAERNSVAGKSAQAAADSSYIVRAKGLAALGLIESPDATFDPPWQADCAKKPRQCQQATLFTIHGISHGIGLAVHDPAQFYDKDVTFKRGDAFTIEPGVYVSSKLLDMLPDTPKNRAFAKKVRPMVQKYEGTGVRIEDDYVITDAGTEWISHVPREIDEIESLMRQKVQATIPEE